MRCLEAEMARRAQWQAADGNLVRDAVANLSREHRAMIYRSYYLGQTTTQIAAELRTKDDIVKHELHRALHALRATLHESDMLR
ncbi:sigma factor-like helix-turn-helix DNA-binding protein [Mycobacterium sp.]|uniref:sigma factor-like helix-turn-helix DNA-binding protein n=1 Tax=Mycobacterium sp. TaxID=1785 RepID=UPI003D6A9A8D